MPVYIDQSNGTECVMVKGGIVVWDGVTQPEAMEEGGGHKWELKIVIPPHNPDGALVDALATKALQDSEFQGVLPHGGLWATKPAGPTDLGGEFNGWTIIKGITYRAPAVYDEQGQVLAPMVYGPKMYSGQTVDMLVTCKAYNNKSKGVKCQLEGFSIIASANSPQLNLGGGGVDHSGAFGGGQPQQGGYQAPAQGQPQQGGYQAPAQGQPQPGVPQSPPAYGAGAPNTATSGTTTSPSNPPHQNSQFFPQ